MKFQYCPTTQCPDCKMYHIVKCFHAESGSEKDHAEVSITSDEKISLKVEPKGNL